MSRQATVFSRLADAKLCFLRETSDVYYEAFRTEGIKSLVCSLVLEGYYSCSTEDDIVS
jgi:hypothetical protein